MIYELTISVVFDQIGNSSVENFNKDIIWRNWHARHSEIIVWKLNIKEKKENGELYLVYIYLTYLIYMIQK